MRCCHLSPLSLLQLEEMNCLCPTNLARPFLDQVIDTYHRSSDLYCHFTPYDQGTKLLSPTSILVALSQAQLVNQRMIRWFSLVVGDHLTPELGWLDHADNESDKLTNFSMLRYQNASDLGPLMAPTIVSLDYRSTVTI